MHNYKFIIYLTVLFFSFQLKGQDNRCRAFEAVISNKAFIKGFSDCLKSDTVLIIDTQYQFNCNISEANSRYVITNVVPDNFDINRSCCHEFEDMLMVSYFSENSNSIKIGFLALATHVQLVFECNVKRRKVKVKLIHEGVF